MTISRLAIDVPYLLRMKGAESSHDLWMSISNDEAYRLQVWMEAASGKWTHLMDDDSPETWRTAQLTVRALERSVSILNYLLTSEVATPGDVKVLKGWLNSTDSSMFQQERTIVISMLQSLFEYLLGMGSAEERAGGRVLNELVVLKTEEPYHLRWPGHTFDVFVSYKHVRDGERAASLAGCLRTLGLECWLDRVQLKLDPGLVMVDLLLKRWLREALTASTCTVFFETALEAIADEDFRGNHVAFNWQVFEHRYARNVAYVRPSKSQVYFKDGRTLAWTTIPELAELIAGHVRGLPATSQADIQSPDEQVDLTCAVKNLQQHGRAYNSGLHSTTPLAALALLAPQTIDQNINESAPGADDVLLALARYDARTATALLSAGIDLYAMFAAGSKILGGRWSDSGTYRWADALGPDYGHRQLPAVLTETDLLNGLATQVVSGAGAIRKLLQRTFRLTHNTWTPEQVDEAVQQTATQLIACSAENECIHSCRHGRHGWLILRAGNTLRAVPVVRHGVYQLAEDCQPLPQNAAVYVRQTRYLFPEHVIADIEDTINDGRQELFDRALERYPEFALTFTGTPASCTVHILAGADDDISLLLLDAGEIRAVSCATESSPPSDAAHLAEVLRRLRPSVESSSRWNWPIAKAHTLDGVLIADKCTLRPAGPELSELGLLADVLSPLLRYHHVRELDYDDF